MYPTPRPNNVRLSMKDSASASVATMARGKSDRALNTVSR